MKISNEKPAIFKKCQEAFGVDWDSGVIIAYGDTVYTKSKGISPDLIVHEMTHIRQQEQIGKDVWWDRYIADKDFRLQQEMEAYENQCKYIRTHIMNIKKRIFLFEHIWSSMSRLYGHMITYEKAKELLPL